MFTNTLFRIGCSAVHYTRVHVHARLWYKFYYRYSLRNFKTWYNFDWKLSILAGKNIYACVYTLCVRVRTWVHMCVRVCNTLLMRSKQLPKCFRETVAIATMPCLGMSGCTGMLQAHTLYQQSNLFADSPLASLLLASDTNNYAIMEAKYSKDFWNCLLYRTKWIPVSFSPDLYPMPSIKESTIKTSQVLMLFNQGWNLIVHVHGMPAGITGSL